MHLVLAYATKKEEKKEKIILLDLNLKVDVRKREEKEEPPEGKMPQGRTGWASWSCDGKYMCGADSGPDTAPMTSCSTIHSNPGRE